MSPETFPLRPSDAGDFADFRLYLTAIGRIPLLSAAEEVTLARQIEAGQAAQQLLTPPQDRPPALTAHTQRYYKYPLLTKDEYLQDLETVAQEGRAAKQQFVAANLRLVADQAYRLNPHPAGLLNRVQIGNLGLIRAVEKFDYTKGYKFSTYAMTWIKKALYTAYREERSIRFPSHIEENLERLRREQQKWTAAMHHDPTAAQLAVSTGFTQEQVTNLLELQRTVMSVVSLEVPVQGSDDLTLGEAIAAKTGADDDMLRHLDNKHVREIVGTALNEQERLAITHHYGLTGEALTQTQIAKVMNLSRERIRQLINIALAKLRGHLQDQGMSMASFEQ